MRAFLLLFFALLAIILVSKAQANTVAYYEFCSRHPQECVVDPGEAAVIPATTVYMNLIRRVNTQVNSSVRQVRDGVHWKGVEDRWDFAEDGSGDCEDMVLLKRKLLRQAGIPHRAMRIAIVITPWGEGHAVLVVRTDGGDFVLDNVVREVLPIGKSKHTFQSIESQNHARTFQKMSKELAENRYELLGVKDLSVAVVDPPEGGVP
jgi:predicted transglutaminase-like cysteine proteinase